MELVVIHQKPPGLSQPVALGCSAWLPSSKRAAPLARALLRAFLRKFSISELFSPAGELVISELIANAVVHGSAGLDEPIFLWFEGSSECLRIEVRDSSAEPPTVRPVEPEDESGRGLWLINELALTWGHGPRDDGPGKRVWVSIAPAHMGLL
ncbi:ATP-binding protein [Kitasatospora viridis]|uniref:ATP-binding protein n=1 Tax=Kitasatospora viridis TaxID=281105 RepID=UPI001478EDDF|nr:ATP-binding protein [Kitasatospora viridis]